MRMSAFLLLLSLFLPYSHAGTFDKFWFASTENDFARWIHSQQKARTAKTFAVTGTVLRVRMRDGVRLYTSVYVPSGGGSFPVILVRTPYNRVIGGADSFAYSGIADYYLPRGYAVVIQSIRGKYDSEGTYRLFSSGEIDDGFDTIEWIAGQTWSNGNVAVMGVSHDGLTALASGVGNPSALKLILAGGAPGDLRVDAFITGGVIQTGLLDYIAYISLEKGIPYDDVFYALYLEKLLHEPRLKVHDNKVEKVQLPLWDELIPQLNTPTSEYWKMRRIRDRIPEIRVPVVHIAGLTGDGDMPDTVKNYLAMSSNPDIRTLQRLILGWWGHSGSGPYGDLSNITPYLLDRINAYLDFYLKGIESPLLKEKRVQAFSKGEEKWVYSDQWPIKKNSESLRFFLAGNHKLSPRPQSASSSDSYLCDPEVEPSILSQNILSSSSDQLVYLSAPVKKDIHVLGDASFQLFAASDAADTDWIILVFKRNAAGEDEMLAPLWGMMQARFRNGSSGNPELLIPGEVYEYNIPFAPISGTVKKGERLGILILSNVNPGVVRNANTGNKIGQDRTFNTARQSIHRGHTYPSVLTLAIRK